MWRWVFAIWMGAVSMASAEVLERFDDGAGARWQFIKDGVMGGLSTGAAEITGEGLHLTGQVRLENNGGFIQVRRKLDGGLPEGSQALVLRVRGNGERYTVFLRTTDARRPWHNYKASFVAGPEWSDARLAFAAFEASNRSLPAEIAPEDVVSIGIAGYGAAYEADVWVREVAVE